MEDSATGTSAAALSTLLHHFGVFSDQPSSRTFATSKAMQSILLQSSMFDWNKPMATSLLYGCGVLLIFHESLTAFYRRDVPSYVREEHGHDPHQ